MARAKPHGRMTPVALLVAMALGSMACGGEQGVAAEPHPWLEIGSGLAQYAAVGDGDPIELVAGPQGGWHVDLAARFGGMPPHDLVLTFRLWDRDEQVQIGYPMKTFVTEERVTARVDGSFVRVGERIVMIHPPEETVGREVVATVQAISKGALLEDRRLLRIVDLQP